MKKLLKFIANFSFFLLPSPFWSLGQDKQKAEAEKQMTQKLATKTPNIIFL